MRIESRKMQISSWEEAEALAGRLDAEDDLAEFRGKFHLPRDTNGKFKTYMCGNSLGLMPRVTTQRLQQHLETWGQTGVEGHFHGKEAWLTIEDATSTLSSNIVGAKSPLEVVYMNTLTVNIHLMMVAFYRPKGERFKVLIEQKAFPSDDYAVQAQVKFHGHDPESAIIRLRPREGESTLRTEDILGTIERERDSLALVFFPGVQYLTGQVLPMAAIAETASRHSIPVGFDLAHAVGNIEVFLHDWGVDFAVWCSYKYLNAGPGAVSGVFLHEKHAHNKELPRLAGWWGYDRKSRFQMNETFIPQPGAYGFQLSNPPVLASVPIVSSLELFEEAGITNIRRKSEKLTLYLETLLLKFVGSEIEMLTPLNPEERGNQISIQLKRANLQKVQSFLESVGVVCDIREPDVLRISPVPLYSTFHDVFSVVKCLSDAIQKQGLHN
ncbi:hypothetical protein NDN08_001205 [Rhodosorus marinus]|uniref:Kynureninase n=1 Tax=Rhodosorus marinus TaxID=101924 RepID=A0AAV8UUC2_9RHOD|nr:hypothetical protein NDN08_001205 [Rhodosorus marinus]